MDGGRPIIPFYVAEHVCSKDNLGGHSQVDSCVVDYNLTKVCTAMRMRPKDRKVLIIDTRIGQF